MAWSEIQSATPNSRRWSRSDEAIDLLAEPAAEPSEKSESKAAAVPGLAQTQTTTLGPTPGLAETPQTEVTPTVTLAQYAPPQSLTETPKSGPFDVPVVPGQKDVDPYAPTDKDKAFVQSLVSRAQTPPPAQAAQPSGTKSQ